MNTAAVYLRASEENVVKFDYLVCVTYYRVRVC